MKSRVEPQKGGLARDYMAAVAFVLIGAATRFLLNPILGARAPWVFFFPALAVAGWRFGPRPTLVALLLSAVIGWIAFVGKPGGIVAESVVDLYVLLAYLLSGGIIVGFSAANQRTKQRLSHESAERERTSWELVESLESFQGIFQHAQGDAMILMDSAFHVLAWNPGARAIFGNSPEEVVGRKVDFIFPAEERDRESTLETRRNATASGYAAESGWYRRKDGQRFWGSGSLVALHRADGEIRGYVKILRDETARFELEEANRQHAEALERHVTEATADLRAVNAELEGFTYSVSHDMRAPLRAIVGHARILIEDYADDLPEDARERIERMAKASTRMSQLIEDLLTYARLNKQAVNKKSVDLAAIFRKVVADESGEIPIDAYAPAELPVHAEPGSMRMVLENLVGNAVKYRRAEVPLRLKFMLVDHDGMCGYALRDNGIGFEMKYAPKLFEPFERLHRNDRGHGNRACERSSDRLEARRRCVGGRGAGIGCDFRLYVALGFTT